MSATRLLRNKWLLLLGVLAVVGLAAGQSLADEPHHGGYYGHSYGGHGGHGGYGRWSPSWGHWGGHDGYYSPSYECRRPVIVRPPIMPYYGGYTTYGCTPGVRVIIVVR